ncbi:MAG: hypothetical protein J2P36_01630, partial [Ktedonobacteraceae bacterium]|nr:hypothetical protein [Ktedonobacteraceae bacterium]
PLTRLPLRGQAVWKESPAAARRGKNAGGPFLFRSATALRAYRCAASRAERQPLSCTSRFVPFT